MGAEVQRRFIGLATAGGMLGAYGLGALVYVLLAHALINRLGQAGPAAWGGVLLAAAYVTLVSPWRLPHGCGSRLWRSQ